MNDMAPVIPPHVPPELVYDFDHFDAPELLSEPHRRVSERLHGNAPPIFWTPRQGGYWIVTRAELGIEVLRDTEKFSSLPEFNKAKDFKPPMLPIQVDPPLHGEMRKIVNPAVAPGAVAKMEADIRAFARELIASVQPRGSCEFLHDVAEVFPVTIFLRLAGAPLQDRPLLLGIAERYVRSPAFEDRAQAIRDLAAYLGDMFEARRGSPGTDLISRVVNGEVTENGVKRKLTQTEIEGFGVLLFLGGLDTVKSVLTFMVGYLAQNPAQYAALVAHPETIGKAMEEMMRIGGVSTPERGATGEFEFHGVQFRRGDRVVLLTQLWGVDASYVANPMTVDFGRDISQHLIFGAGPHRCAGSHLARLEIRVFLEEWARAIPTFSIPGNTPIQTSCGVVWSPTALPLVWG